MTMSSTTKETNAPGECIVLFERCLFVARGIRGDGPTVSGRGVIIARVVDAHDPRFDSILVLMDGGAIGWSWCAGREELPRPEVTP